MQRLPMNWTAYVAVEYVPVCNECGAMDSEFTEDAGKDALREHMAIEHGALTMNLRPSLPNIRRSRGR